MNSCFTCDLPCKKQITGCPKWRPVQSLNSFDPIPILEAAGISNFNVDYDRKRVKLSGPDLVKLKKVIGDKVYYYRGWVFGEGLIAEVR